MSYLTDYEEIDAGYVAFGRNPKRGKITGKDFKLTDESHVLLKVPRKNNMYSVDLKNIVLKGVVTDDYSRFTWVFFLASKDETSAILNTFIDGIENLVDHNVKVIRCDNETEFKDSEMNQFCEIKGKFDGKVDEGLFVRYSPNSKVFRVINSRTRIVEENLHIRFSENTPNTTRSGPNWLFDIDALTKSMNYKPVVARNQSNDNAGTKACDDAGKARMETVPGKYYILLPLWTPDPSFSKSSKSPQDNEYQPSSDHEKKVDEVLRQQSEYKDQEKENNDINTNYVNDASTNGVNATDDIPVRLFKANTEIPYLRKFPNVSRMVAQVVESVINDLTGKWLSSRKYAATRLPKVLVAGS
nr:hypothetical protein [Tanacetum cinerariifolium]